MVLGKKVTIFDREWGRKFGPWRWVEKALNIYVLDALKNHINEMVL